jgi:hypothetical protein
MTTLWSRVAGTLLCARANRLSWWGRHASVIIVLVALTGMAGGNPNPSSAASGKQRACGPMKVDATRFYKTTAKGVSCSFARSLIRDASRGNGVYHEGYSNAFSYFAIRGFRCQTDTGLTSCERGAKSAYGFYR